MNINNALVVVRSRDTGTGCNSDLKMAQGNTDSSGNVSFTPAVRDLSHLHQRHSGDFDHSLARDLRDHRLAPGPACAPAEQHDLPGEPPDFHLRSERQLLDRNGHLAVTRRINRLRSDESGFTLIELLVSMTIALMVLMAAFVLLDRSTSISAQISNRQDALQRGRLAMEKIVRDLRSQVCLGDENEPITTAEDNKVTFYVDLSDGSEPVGQRTIRYEPGLDGKPGNLYEDVYEGTGEYPLLVFEGTPETRLLVSNVRPIMDGGVARPILRYYAFRNGGVPGDLELLPAPLVPNDAIRTVMVKVGFTVEPERKAPKNSEITTLESDVYVRLADPSRPLEGPRCV